MARQKNDFGVEQRSSGGFSGFVEEDIDAMFSEAIRGSANDDEDKNSASVIAPAPQEDTPAMQSAPVEELAPEPVVQAPLEVEQGQAEVESAPEVAQEEEEPQAVETLAPQPQLQPEPGPEPAYEEVAPVAFDNSTNVDVDANFAMVSRIIGTLDTYRDLKADARAVAAQFICNDSDANPDDEVAIVVNSLTSDKAKEQSMYHLVRAYEEKERVERLFLLLQLSTNEVAALGSLMEIILGEIDFTRRDRIRFAKEVESYINQLDPEIVDYVAATQRVLKAADSKA